MKKKGFTLFELLVSISIIAILTALATISYSAAQKKARDSKRIQDMDAIQKAEEQWYLTNNSTYNTACTPGSVWRDTVGNIAFTVPNDPKSTAHYYVNCPSGTHLYCYCAQMENPTGNSSDSTCDNISANGTGAWECVTNQQ
jgi:prepilin-type N-terminal cleavage/methylation domain-containing protein